jgi:Cof subfamily protein (haloacid dehalogenase superfamily)
MTKSSKKSLPWVFIDIDSTLQVPGQSVSAGNREAIGHYLKKKGRISFATGKHPLAIHELLQNFPQAGPHIVLNGGAIVEPTGVRQLVSIDKQATALERFLRAHGIEHVGYFLKGLFCSPAWICNENLELLASFGEPQPRLTDDWPAEGMVKILAFVEDSDKETEVMFRKEANAQQVRAIRTADHFLEFISQDSGKEMAMRKILAEAKRPVAQTAAIGDSENDLGMLKLSGRSFAVGDATEKVRSAVDEVVRSCGEDGVAHVLQLLLEQKH